MNRPVPDPHLHSAFTVAAVMSGEGRITSKNKRYPYSHCLKCSCTLLNQIGHLEPFDSGSQAFHEAGIQLLEQSASLPATQPSTHHSAN